MGSLHYYIVTDSDRGPTSTQLDFVITISLHVLTPETPTQTTFCDDCKSIQFCSKGSLINTSHAFQVIMLNHKVERW